MQNKLFIEFTRSEITDFSDPQKKLRYKKDSMKRSHQHLSYIIIESEDDILYAVELFKQAYKRFQEQFSK